MAKTKQRSQRPTGGRPAALSNGKVADAAKLARWERLAAREPLLAASEAAAVLAWWAHVDGLPVPADLFWKALRDPEVTPPSAILSVLAAARDGRARRAAAR